MQKLQFEAQEKDKGRQFEAQKLDMERQERIQIAQIEADTRMKIESAKLQHLNAVDGQEIGIKSGELDVKRQEADRKDRELEYEKALALVRARMGQSDRIAGSVDAIG
jgi:hypothetical protein